MKVLALFFAVCAAAAPALAGDDVRGELLERDGSSSVWVRITAIRAPRIYGVVWISEDSAKSQKATSVLDIDCNGGGRSRVLSMQSLSPGSTLLWKPPAKAVMTMADGQSIEVGKGGPHEWSSIDPTAYQDELLAAWCRRH